MTVDFTGTIDGAPFEGGVGEDIKVVLGQSSFIPGFEQGLEGVMTGEERQVEAEFPGAYLRADLAGKKASFHVKVKEVAHPDPSRSTTSSPRASTWTTWKRSGHR